MSQTATEERPSALDDFVRMGGESAQVPMVVASAPSLDLVHGAQLVAVYRDEERVLQRLRVLAAGMGDQYFYRFPVKNKRTGKIEYIEGPSVKLANDLCRVYGNCEVDCRAQDYGDSWLFHARFIDLETGYSLTRPFQARKSSGKIGGADDDRRLDIAFQIGASKAIRNVVINALQSFADFTFDEARQSLVDKIGKDVEGWRKRTAERIAKLVSLERVEAAIGRKSGEWLVPDIARIIAMGKAISDGMASVDETFPPLKPATEGSKEQLDKFASSGSPEARAPAPPQGSGGSVGPDVSTPASGSADHDPETGEVREPDERDMIGSAFADELDAAVLREECVSACLQIATNVQLDADQRKERLSLVEGYWLDRLDTPFVKMVMSTMTKVAEGKMKPEKARQYLEQLRP